MGVDFRTIDGNNNGYIDAEDERSFDIAVKKFLAQYDVFNYDLQTNEPDGILSSGRRTAVLSENGEDLLTNNKKDVDEVSPFLKANPQFPDPRSLPAFNKKPGISTYPSSSGPRGSSYFNSYMSVLWSQLGGSYGGVAYSSQIKPISLKEIVTNREKYGWIDISEADKAIAADGGVWDAFDKVDTDHDGFIEQKNENSENELQAHMMQFFGTTDPNRPLTVAEQDTYKEKFGLYRVGIIDKTYFP